MMRWMLCTTVILLLIVPVHAQADFVCGQGTGNPAPDITAAEEPDMTGFADHFNTSILAYLNSTGSTNGLEEALVATTGQRLNTVPSTYAQVLESDVTGDGQNDVLVNVAVNNGAAYNAVLSLFTCDEDSYKLLGSVPSADWTGASDESPTSILYAVDINNNQRREIFLKSEILLGQKYGEGLTIYEWDGAVLSPVFSFGPDLGGFSHVLLQDNDGNPATLEFTLGDAYGYGESVAGAVIEITHWRPIDLLYGWDGTGYQPVCTFFTDQPGTLYETLHSAEALARCGRYEEANTYYQHLLNNSDLLAWAQIDAGPPWSSLPALIYPESVEDKKAFAAGLERAYLGAFAVYRTTQIELFKGNTDSALNDVQFAELQYKPGTAGYEYIAMAKVLVDTFQQTSDMRRACDAAQVALQKARESSDDPGIVYYADTLDGQTTSYPFYRSSDIVYSSNPDNLFDVPHDISDMIDMPLCLG